MKKNQIIILFLLLNYFQLNYCVSQNLVPNHSFEIIDTCYSLAAGIYYGHVPPWDSPTLGSPDVYNSCSGATGGSSTVPSNVFGYQYPHSGNGYAGAGFYCFSSISFCPSTYVSEYIQVVLDSPLIAHEKYCASFYVNHANRYYKAALGNFGMYFSPTHTYDSTYCELNFIPQITEPNIISDDSAWVLVYGQYMAQGGEKYIIIGNFNSVSTSDTVHLVNGFPANAYNCYYYIDDINVHCCTCDSTTSLHAGVGEIEKTSQYKLYPNPNDGNMTLEYFLENSETAIFSIYSVDGRLITQQTLNAQNTSLVIDETVLDAGVYYYVIKEGDKNTKEDKLIIIK